jgi:hypothetical protein
VWLESDPTAAVAHTALTTEVMQQLAFTPAADVEFGKKASKHLPAVTSAFFGNSTAADPAELQTRALEHMTAAMRSDTPADTSSADASVAVAEAHMRMGVFAMRCLDEGLQAGADRGELVTHAVRHVLAAMAHGSTAAALKFPAILALACSEGIPNIIYRTFLNGSEAVPSWLFIRWISQMIPHLTKPSAELVQPLFTRLGEEYPGALTYPVMISYDQVLHPTGSVFGSASHCHAMQYLRCDFHAPIYSQIAQEGTPEQRTFAKKLRSRVVTPLIDRFVTELEALHDPNLILQDFKDEVTAHHALPLIVLTIMRRAVRCRFVGSL